MINLNLCFFLIFWTPKPIRIQSEKCVAIKKNFPGWGINLGITMVFGTVYITTNILNLFCVFFRNLRTLKILVVKVKIRVQINVLVKYLLSRFIEVNWGWKILKYLWNIRIRSNKKSIKRTVNFRMFKFLFLNSGGNFRYSVLTKIG